MSSSPQPICVYARWRPLAAIETEVGEFEHAINSQPNRQLHSISIKPEAPHKDKPWSSPAAFKGVFTQEDDNDSIFSQIVAPILPKVLRGATYNYFAYGHSGSGKTHTIIGYDYEHESRLGLSLAAARVLFTELDIHNANAGEDTLGLGLSVFELRKSTAFDLLNERTQCHIRQGADGKTHIRGPTKMLEGGKVRVQPIVQRACWTLDELRKELQKSLGLRAVGSSSVHDQSSRTHAVLELEVINSHLMKARQALYDRQSELVPVGKYADDVQIEEQTKSVIPIEGGGYQPNPDYKVNQEKIDAAEAERARFEARIAEAEEKVASIMHVEGQDTPRLGGRLIFVDLAGSEYQTDPRLSHLLLPKQTPQERQEGRQINTDLLALKEVIRACASGQERIPFRSSPLTMVLREHFLSGKDGTSTMIVTASSAQSQYAATLNSLKYGSLVGVSGK
ncbi:Kinesin-related protein 6 [Daldinia childiae]|uniref:Kinesin-related protein 6 n=1 Tax=Daldinia childiae TaxID=326645 RepID=UPI001444E9C9|nr:Kinesin-related protein 6 [Daldinia childiae]KAF3061628.1 Kinesin-related protein 6 [Daldinia childiae]